MDMGRVWVCMILYSSQIQFTHQFVYYASRKRDLNINSAIVVYLQQNKNREKTKGKKKCHTKTIRGRKAGTTSK